MLFLYFGWIISLSYNMWYLPLQTISHWLASQNQAGQLSIYYWAAWELGRLTESLPTAAQGHSPSETLIRLVWSSSITFSSASMSTLTSIHTQTQHAQLFQKYTSTLTPCMHTYPVCMSVCTGATLKNNVLPSIALFRQLIRRGLVYHCITGA